MDDPDGKDSLDAKKESIKANIELVRRNIEDACLGAGRSDRPTLLLATKTVSPELINFATCECGVSDIGENKVQELIAKYPLINRESVNIHFIGRLQCNKVKYIVPLVSMIHSLDSLRLAEEISRRSLEHGKRTDCLIEINIGREANKGGILPEQAVDFADALGAFDGINLRGIMTIAPDCEKSADYRKYFEETYKIFIDICEKKLHNIDNAVLSMGMSGSYREACLCNSTLVRVGSAIFGSRPSAGMILK